MLSAFAEWSWKLLARVRLAIANRCASPESGLADGKNCSVSAQLFVASRLCRDFFANANPRHTLFLCICRISLLLISPIVLYAQRTPMTALGIDVDFYTGPISRDVWLQLKAARFRICG